MTTLNLTDKTIRSIAVSRRTDFWDDFLPGFGLRVSPGGRKSFILMYRHRGQKRRLTLGVYPTTSLAEARRIARVKLGEVAAGEDPAEERTIARTAPTFADLAEQYLERYARPRKRSWKEDQRMLTLDLLPAWGRWPATEVKKRDVLRLLDAIVDRGAPIVANRTRALISRIYSWGIERDLVEHNPCLGVKPPAQEKRRERVLVESEIRQLWWVLEAEHPPIRDAFRLLILTAQRSVEVLSMTWGQIEKDLWTIPPEIVKGKRSHLVPLSDQAGAVLDVIQSNGRGRAPAGERNSSEPWVLPSPRKPGSRLDATALPQAARRICRQLDWQFWPHDLRRTAASHMTAMGVDRFIVARILNHADSSVTAVYDLYGYLPEKRAALSRWGARVAEIVR